MELRNYQTETLEVLHRMESEYGNFSTVVNLPTGSGKTKIAVSFCDEVLKNKKGKILWLADRNELLRQAEENFQGYETLKRQAIFDKSRNNVSVEPEKQFAKEADVIFATIGSMAKIYKIENGDSSFVDWINGNKLYVIYDEVHHIGASQAFNLFTSLFADSSDDNSVKAFYRIKSFAIVGFTATVYRGDKFIDKFKAFFKDGYDKQNNKLYHSESDYGDYVDVDIQSIDEIRVAVADIDDLIKGYKGEAPVLVEPQLIKVDEFKEGMPPRGEKPDGKGGKKAKEEYLNNENAMKYLAKRISTYGSGWGKLAVIVNTIKEAKQLCKNLENLEKKALRCTSDLSSSDDILKEFKEDKSGEKILVTVHKFDEGVDVPNLETLYLYAKTNSQIVLRQRIGRVVRKIADEKKKANNSTAVVHKIKDKEKIARVIWQQYPEDEQYLDENKFRALLNESYKYKIQTDKEQEEDYVAWLKNNKLQLPAVMYRKPLQADFIENYSEWMLFKAEEIFGSDIISDAKSIGFFYNADEYEDTEDAVFVRNVEYEGYLQFQRLLHNDWITLLRYEKKRDISFDEYADILDTNAGELLENIKEVCFYQKDAHHSDSVGKKTTQRIFVRDGDIKTFFRWFLYGKIEYMNLSVRKKEKKEAESDTGLFNAVLDPDHQEKSLNCKTTVKKLQALRKKLEEQTYADEEDNYEKEYTELLTYGEGKSDRDNYQEMLSKKLMMRAGITDILPRVIIGQSTTEGSKDIDAFNGVKTIKRKSNTVIRREDWILYASALIEIPNHIFITQDDVNKYEDALLGSILIKVSQDQKEQAVKECLLALGYVNNYEIIKYQCQKIKEAKIALPKLLQCVVYQKCYNELVKKVKFVRDKVLHPACVNMQDLRNHYNDCLGRLEVDAVSMVIDPVNDVIHDYRPYLKAIYYYQGIKPEFLCRMANDLIEFSKVQPNRVIDGFGGSGACTMNGFFTNMQPTQVYNDYGVMNTAFYRCLQSPEQLNKLIEQIKCIIDEAFSNYAEGRKIQYLSNKYGKFITACIEEEKKDSEKKIPTKKDSDKKDSDKKSLPIIYWDKSIKECEECYVAAYDKTVKAEGGNQTEVGTDKGKNNKDKKDRRLSYRNIKIEDRLAYINQKMGKDLTAIRNVERYFHVFMLQLNTVYLAMTDVFSKDRLKGYNISDVDLAVLFFFYNTLSHRHFYNDCTIGQIGSMMVNYKKWLGYGVECFKNVDILQEDALELLGYETYNREDTTWYLDIPYAETDSSDYVTQWFDMKKFVTALSNLKGNYIVSSRCNICLPNAEKRELSQISRDDLKDISEDELVDLSKEDGISERYTKELNVFSFFSSFVDKADDVIKFIESLKIKQDSKEKEEDVKETTCSIETKHISSNKKAEYILIPYTKMSEEYYDEDGRVKRSLIENSSVISEDYVRRMLAATRYSNIPVDIMVTDIDIDINRMPIQPTYDAVGQKSESVYVLPTFKTGIDASHYMVEPAVIIMKYDKFMEILCSLLYREEWRCYRQDKEARDSAELFRNLFKMG